MPVQKTSMNLSVNIGFEGYRVYFNVPGAKEYIHQGFADPSESKGKEKEILLIFLKIQDEIHSWLKEILK